MRERENRTRRRRRKERERERHTVARAHIWRKRRNDEGALAE